jgi:hypothetical protein
VQLKAGDNSLTLDPTSGTPVRQVGRDWAGKTKRRHGGGWK